MFSLDSSQIESAIPNLILSLKDRKNISWYDTEHYNILIDLKQKFLKRLHIVKFDEI